MEVVQDPTKLTAQLLIHPIKYYDCIEACFETANSSWICADACLNEREMAELKDCIDLCLKTAEVAAATARILVRGEEYPFETTLKQLRACMEACARTSSECSKFADRHEHCLISARSADQCFRICQSCIGALSAT